MVSYLLFPWFYKECVGDNFEFGEEGEEHDFEFVDSGNHNQEDDYFD